MGVTTFKNTAGTLSWKACKWFKGQYIQRSFSSKCWANTKDAAERYQEIIETLITDHPHETRERICEMLEDLAFDEGYWYRFSGTGRPPKKQKA